MGFNTLDHEAVFEEAEFFRPVITQKRRITSYNVCYTKLLRHRSLGGVPDHYQLLGRGEDKA